MHQMQSLHVLCLGVSPASRSCVLEGLKMSMRRSLAFSSCRRQGLDLQGQVRSPQKMFWLLLTCYADLSWGTLSLPLHKIRAFHI